MLGKSKINRKDCLQSVLINVVLFRAGKGGIKLITKYYQVSCDVCCESEWVENKTKKEAIKDAKQAGLIVMKNGRIFCEWHKDFKRQKK